MRITSKGQVTIPVDIRELAGLLPHTEVRFVYDGTTVTVVPVRDRAAATEGGDFVDRMSGRSDVGMTTDEIMALMRGPAPDDE